ncbi:anti-sigma factor domain-containing protein [Tepidamorphus sp. 3E244]|uniref:anti-sigma factor n=1 Tax=Tepidamorphus sp. 3E244 TaxID=3385498 RepID=UPI0038FD33F4
MTDSLAYPTPPEDANLLAAEYALGVLDAQERAAMEARVARDGAFANLVATWEQHFSGLNGGFDELPPPAHVKSAINTRLFGATDAKSSGGFWSNAAFWRMTTLAATTALAILAFVTLREPIVPPVAGDTLVASLETEAGDTRFLVLYDPRDLTIRASLLDGETPDGRDYELWYVPAEGGGGPISLGLIGGTGARAPHVPEDLDRKFADGMTIAVSLEPQGGSQTGAPTGPVVAAGPAKKI